MTAEAPMAQHHARNLPRCQAGFERFRERQDASIDPVNYGVADGLRSAQCAPGYPTSRGGDRTADGRLWFPTSRGMAVLDPQRRNRRAWPRRWFTCWMSTVDDRPVRSD